MICKTTQLQYSRKNPAVNSHRNQVVGKCVARKCPNKNVVDLGICLKCGGSEHFKCAGTKEEENKYIIEGIQEYLCSNCLFKNPGF